MPRAERWDRDGRLIVGFYTDSDGETRPITRGHAEAIHRRYAGKHGKPRRKWTAEQIASGEAKYYEDLAREIEREAIKADDDERARDAFEATYAAIDRPGRVATRALHSLVGSGWSELRSEILARGGISRGSGGDHSRHTYDRDRIPRPLYRLRGANPDELASELGWESTDHMLRDLELAFNSDRRRRRHRERSAKPTLGRVVRRVIYG